MPPLANNAYLEAQILTATPQKRQWMLLEAAVRQGYRTLDLWREEKWLEAGDVLANCRDIVAEIIRALRPDVAPDLVARVTDLYAWVFRQLVDAGFKHEVGPLRDALRVLEIERDTWRELCETYRAPPVPLKLESTGDAGRFQLNA